MSVVTLELADGIERAVAAGACEVGLLEELDGTTLVVTGGGRVGGEISRSAEEVKILIRLGMFVLKHREHLLEQLGGPGPEPEPYDFEIPPERPSLYELSLSIEKRLAGLERTVEHGKEKWEQRWVNARACLDTFLTMTIDRDGPPPTESPI